MYLEARFRLVLVSFRRLVFLDFIVSLRVRRLLSGDYFRLDFHLWPVSRASALPVAWYARSAVT